VARRQYHYIQKVSLHSFEQEDGSVGANFDAFGPEYADDHFRMGEPAYPPNQRRWRLETEQDMVVWFHTEVSNVVLAGWTSQPDILQTSQGKPLHGNVPEMADVLYSIKVHNKRLPLVVGEAKRCLIKGQFWQNGRPDKSESQKALSRELRGFVPEHPHALEVPLLIAPSMSGMLISTSALRIFVLTEISS